MVVPRMAAEDWPLAIGEGFCPRCVVPLGPAANRGIPLAGGNCAAGGDDWFTGTADAPFALPFGQNGVNANFVGCLLRRSGA